MIAADATNGQGAAPKATPVAPLPMTPLAPTPLPASPLTPPTAATGATPSIPLASAPMPAATPPAPQAPAPAASPATPPIPLASSTPAPGVNVTPNTPGSATDYTSQTITPGAGVDRLKLANDTFESSAKASDPYYQKTLRDANSAAGANGQLGSGELRTSLGDAASNRALNLDTLRSGLMHDATAGSIEDQYRNIGIAQQQQGVQNGQQQTAFNQAQQQAALEEALRSGDFSRASQLLSLGMAGNPSDTALQLANSYGTQASNAGSAAGNLLGNAVKNSGTGAPAATGAPGGEGFDWSSLLGHIPGLGGDLPPIAQTPDAGQALPIDTGYHGPVVQPKALPLAGAY